MDQSTLTTVLLVAIVGFIAYLIGDRRAAKRAEDATKKENFGAIREPSKGPGNVAPAVPSKAPAAAVPSKAPEAPASKPGPAPLEAVAHLPAFEGEDDAVDPTMIGQTASAPPEVRVIRTPPVKKIILDEGATSEDLVQQAPLFLVSATAQTDKGLKRKRNEDSVGVLESRNLYVVADGMGGYAGGDEASKITVEQLVDAFRSNTFEGPAIEGVPREASDMARAIQTANATINERAQRDPKLKGMGTTVVSVTFSENKRRLYIGHVGDSRCYRLRDGAFKQLTADHTMAELGIKGPESAHLSRAVGIWPTVPIDIMMGVPQNGDVYLLCSDGLTKMLNDEAIANVLRSEEDPKVAVERLIFFANSRGGKDNITVVLIRVVPLDWKPESST